MILLDENIPEGHRLALRKWKPFQIGVDRSKKGFGDEQIVVLLRSQRNLTFFTRDEDFYQKRRQYGHSNCAIVVVEPRLIGRFSVFVDRFLRHPSFKIFANRKGLVIRLSSAGITCWRVADRRQYHLPWVANG